jgi:hypothetical protein
MLFLWLNEGWHKPDIYSRHGGNGKCLKFSSGSPGKNMLVSLKCIWEDNVSVSETVWENVQWIQLFCDWIKEMWFVINVECSGCTKVWHLSQRTTLKLVNTVMCLTFLSRDNEYHCLLEVWHCVVSLLFHCLSPFVRIVISSSTPQSTIRFSPLFLNS